MDNVSATGYPGRLQSTSWHGQAAWVLESATTRVVMVPGMGAKIVSLVDRRAGFEWLAGPVPGRLVQPVGYGAPFERQDMAGWDEMFPTIVACPYPEAGALPGACAGAPLPDHGEAWCLPWTTLDAPAGDLALGLTGRALPYHLARSAGFDAQGALRLRYTLDNLGDEPMPYLWAAHPQFVAGPDLQIFLPAQVTEVINTLPATWGWGPPETRFDWPQATTVDGRRVRLDEVGLPSARTARKVCALPDARPSWVALLSRASGCWLRLDWQPAEVPYLGLWVDEGAVHAQAVVSPQPSTGWYDSLALAWRKRQVKIVPAGATHAWALTVRLGNDGDPCGPDDVMRKRDA